MNDIYELWSLPWHVLQRSLAGGIRAHDDSQSAAKRGLVRGAAHFREVNAQGSAGSWLGRAQHRRAAPRYP
jgi:hypothetical protein